MNFAEPEPDPERYFKRLKAVVRTTYKKTAVEFYQHFEAFCSFYNAFFSSVYFSETLKDDFNFIIFQINTHSFGTIETNSSFIVSNLNGFKE